MAAGSASARTACPIPPISASLGPATATQVLYTLMPVSTPPTGLIQYLLFISLVLDTLAIRFSVSSGCARRRCSASAILVLPSLQSLLLHTSTLTSGGVGYFCSFCEESAGLSSFVACCLPGKPSGVSPQTLPLPPSLRFLSGRLNSCTVDALGLPRLLASSVKTFVSLGYNLDTLFRSIIKILLIFLIHLFFKRLIGFGCYA